MNNDFFTHMHEREQSKIPINMELKAKLARDLKLNRSPSWFNRTFHVLRTIVRQPVGGFALACALVLVISLSVNRPTRFPAGITFGPVTDDWQYTGIIPEVEQKMASSLSRTFNSAPSAISAPAVPMMAYESAVDATLGFSVGGAKDINTFRESIKNGFLPLESDVTYEGLFYDYSFDTGRRQSCTELFCPSSARALVRNPLTGQDEYYLSVGLNSNIKESDFKRPKTNFVVVLDISGSMSSPFDQYYTDQAGKRVEAPATERNKTKMQLASESLSALVDQLKPDDRLGIVLFSDTATVAKPLRLVGETDRSALKRHIMELTPTNGTNMSAGLEEGMKMLSGSVGQLDEYSDRMIFITDAMPNQGDFGARGLHGLIEDYAKQGVQTSMLGVGVDFQTELVEALTKVRGANYLSIHSAQDFKRRLGEEFDFLVTPLVYDLRLNVKGSGFAIEEIYGSPDADLSSGEIVHIRTLFPSKTRNGEVKGGLVLLKLKKTGESPSVELQTTYEDTKGGKFTTVGTTSFQGLSSGASDNAGIRKGVLLVQYAHLLKEWIQQERGGRDPFFSSGATNWDRTSRPLQVSGVYKTRFMQFAEYFKNEAGMIRDATLSQEQEILDKLIKQAPGGIMEPPVVTPQPTDDWRF